MPTWSKHDWSASYGKPPGPRSASTGSRSWKNGTNAGSYNQWMASPETWTHKNSYGDPAQSSWDEPPQNSQAQVRSGSKAERSRSRRGTSPYHNPLGMGKKGAGKASKSQSDDSVPPPPESPDGYYDCVDFIAMPSRGNGVWYARRVDLPEDHEFKYKEQLYLPGSTITILPPMGDMTEGSWEYGTQHLKPGQRGYKEPQRLGYPLTKQRRIWLEQVHKYWVDNGPPEPADLSPGQRERN